MKSKKLISIVIPVYNEEEGLPELLKRILKFIKSFSIYSFEIIFVENGSTDKSYVVLSQYAHRNKQIKVLQLSKNFGTENGIEAGIHYAKGEALVIMMADLQEPLSLIKDFINKWEQGYEIVYGIVRKRTASFFRNIFSVLFYKTINLLTGNMFPENASDFKLIDKKVYEIINKMSEQNKYLRGLIIWTGFKQIGIPFNREKRYAGKSKADFKTVIGIVFNAIFSFSYVPLHIMSIIGIIVTIFSSALMLLYLYLFIVYGQVTPGIMTIIMILLFLFGILFLFLGIISEYLARIYNEVKKRPLFIERNKINL
ncbi:MAG: Glycosyl transferase family 2 [Candidatus Gottesmanbacteria bacterium GW2011_GWA1_34_13]|uniref:Glycosyl transferase family 2 n=1 Tax=Candidatus Gottesmanbacteria bacterium GW2011_GWA1_34_13 TaxID=1618434 RepID=A0A0G0ASQ1_9BACT|nr:MAG: Glycosyl transferase family 2 [Candidatus Gottesmanbacteria bacterium GW2011_GWA1_34_13]